MRQDCPEYVSGNLRAAKAFDPNGITELAGLMVHEATHGLLHAKGFKLDLDSQEQHERICLAEQFRFLRKMVLADKKLSEIERTNQTEQLKKDVREAWQTRWWDSKIIQERQINRLKSIFFKKTK